MKTQRRDILQLFIDTGVDQNMKSEKGNTRLHTAIMRCRQLQKVAVQNRIIGCFGTLPQPLKGNLLRKIVSAPQQVSDRCTSDNVERCSPEDMVHCLIPGADLNVLSARGFTPLALAENGPSSVKQLLVDSGAK